MAITGNTFKIPQLSSFQNLNTVLYRKTATRIRGPHTPILTMEGKIIKICMFPRLYDWLYGTCRYISLRKSGQKFQTNNIKNQLFGILLRNASQISWWFHFNLTKKRCDETKVKTITVKNSKNCLSLFENFKKRWRFDVYSTSFSSQNE